MTGRQPDQACPVVDHVLFPLRGPAGSMFSLLDGYQAVGHPAVRSEEAGGYWIFTDHDLILEGLQQPDLWSSSSNTVTEPNPPFGLIPVNLDPPEHTLWRKLLGGYFSPGRIRSMKDEQHRVAAEVIIGLRDKGQCDFVRDFAQVFPATVFLQIMGMSQDKLDEFMEWEHMILHPTPGSDPDGSIKLAGMQKVMDYFRELIAVRRAEPAPEARDIVSAAVQWEVHDRPAADDEILSCLLLLFMAGLDTVAGQASYALFHLATHAEDRRRLVAEPRLVPQAVEELLRAHPIVQTGRKATRDAVFGGCPVKAGDMALFPLAIAGRDEHVYPDARTVDLDREVTRHLSFGAGPHRCLGSHLARQELAVVLQEWHRLIPEYELVGEPIEHGGTVWGVESLLLRW